MAKVAFSKLALKKQDDVKIVKIGNVDIEVKQYLPVNDKLDLITRVLTNAHDSNNFQNPIKVEVISSIEIIMAYTNLTFTEKQREDIAKLYDLLSENKILEQIFDVIPEDELTFVLDGIADTTNAVYTYQNSVLGILDSIVKDYNDLNFDASEIQAKIADPENLDLLKAILNRLG